MLWVVSPVDHTLSTAEDEVRITKSPSQNVVGPPGMIVGVVGAPGSESVTHTVFELHPSLKVN
jgi:hypothetical protein